MAGRNSATNLTGLLSGISNSFKGLGDTGTMFTQNIRDYAAPEIDTEDPMSLVKYAQWAQRNGDQQTAQKYQAAASALQKNKQDRNDTLQIGEMQQTLKDLEFQRQQALQGAAATEQTTLADEQALINANFDRARNGLAIRLNEFSKGSNVGTGLEGSQHLDARRGIESMSGILRNKLTLAKENEKPVIRAMISGLHSGSVTPESVVEYLQDPGAATVTNTASWETAKKFADSHNASNGFTEVDEGFMYPHEAFEQTTKMIRNVGNAADVATAVAGAGQGIKDDTAAVDGLNGMGKTIGLYDEALAQIALGANTGVLENNFPSLFAPSISLQNVANQLGLQVVAGTTFGALSAPELKMAMATGLPTGLQEEDLADWVRRRKIAVEKGMVEIRKFLIWRGQAGNQNKTAADYQRDILHQERVDSAEAPAHTDDSTAEGESVTMPSGIVITRQGQ